jgi:DDE superfamily endonuclease
VLDNLAVHKAPAVRAALDRAWISYRYLPSYSPDFNPMEPCWAKLKAHFRARAARSIEALEAELPSALRTITPGDAQGWFRRYLPGRCANRCSGDASRIRAPQSRAEAEGQVAHGRTTSQASRRSFPSTSAPAGSRRSQPCCSKIPMMRRAVSLSRMAPGPCW